MRTLSADERFALLCMVGTFPDICWTEGDADDARWTATHASLTERGCAVEIVRDDPYDDDWEIAEYDITDLGRLALRVSCQMVGAS